MSASWHGNADPSDTDHTFTVLVPVSNPAAVPALVSIASAIAKARKGQVLAITYVGVPDQTPLAAARERGEGDDRRELLETATRTAAELGATIETRIVYTHGAIEAIFETARRDDVDLCLLGWGPALPGVRGRTERVLDELANALPCDILVYEHRGFDPAELLLPTTGGPHSQLAAMAARALRREFDAAVTLLHVSDDPDAAAFLAEWAREVGLPDARREVVSGEIEDGIETQAAAHTMIVIGATESGLLSRLVRGSLTIDVLNRVDCSVLIAERRSDRGLLERILQR